MSYGVVQAEKMTTESGYSLGAGNASSFKNRIINGEMDIDQRNGGASLTVNAPTRTYSLDRWFGYGQSTDGVFTIQQSSVAPAGFTRSALITVTTADASIGSGQLYLLGQTIEGFNVADLGWGTANAKPVTLSFWVRSSVTGTFGGILNNYSQDRTYPFTYTISSANTWEQKSVTIVGDTTGTWNTTNSGGIQVMYGFGIGSSFLASAGAWAAGTFFGATGQTNIISTLGATWYITGVQLEVGTVATSFDFRSIGTELALCQRYYWQMNSTTAPYTITGTVGGSDNLHNFFHPVTMRAAPTATSTGNLSAYYFTSAGSAQVGPTSVSSITFNTNTNGGRFYFAKLGQSGLACWVDFGGASIVMNFNSEL